MATKNSSWLKKGYWGFVQGENFFRHFLLLIIRLYWGSLFVITGMGKLMNGQGVGDYFNSLNIPYPFFSAYFVGCIELLGGVSLIFGFLARLFSPLLSIILITAYATAHNEVFQHSIQSFPSEFIMQQPFHFLYASLIVLCFGSGLFSIDYWLEKRSYGKAL